MHIISIDVRGDDESNTNEFANYRHDAVWCVFVCARCIYTKAYEIALCDVGVYLYIYTIHIATVNVHVHIGDYILRRGISIYRVYIYV